MVLFSWGIVAAQTGTSNGGRKSRYDQTYNTQTYTKINGQVMSIEKVVSQKGASAGIHMTVKTKTGTYTVHLGPKWYLDKQGVPINTGDQVEVGGSKVTIDSKPVIIAKEVIKEGHTLKLRDEDGKPLWSGKGNK